MNSVGPSRKPAKRSWGCDSGQGGFKGRETERRGCSRGGKASDGCRARKVTFTNPASEDTQRQRQRQRGRTAGGGLIIRRRGKERRSRHGLRHKHPWGMGREQTKQQQQTRAHTRGPYLTSSWQLVQLAPGHTAWWGCRWSRPTSSDSPECDGSWHGVFAPKKLLLDGGLGGIGGDKGGGGDGDSDRWIGRSAWHESSGRLGRLVANANRPIALVSPSLAVRPSGPQAVERIMALVHTAITLAADDESQARRGGCAGPPRRKSPG